MGQAGLDSSCKGILSSKGLELAIWIFHSYITPDSLVSLTSWGGLILCCFECGSKLQGSGCLDYCSCPLSAFGLFPFVPFSVMQPKFKSFPVWGQLPSRWEGVSVTWDFESPIFPTSFHVFVHVQLGQDLCLSPQYCKKPGVYVISWLPLQLSPWQPEPSAGHWKRASEEEPAWFVLTFSLDSSCWEHLPCTCAEQSLSRNGIDLELVPDFEGLVVSWPRYRTSWSSSVTLKVLALKPGAFPLPLNWFEMPPFRLLSRSTRVGRGGPEIWVLTKAPSPWWWWRLEFENRRSN